jgi:preprotein translocase subunit SecA
MVTRAIERAQKQVEAQNFSVRKHLLEYDDVMNKQRENIYALRRQMLDGQIKLSDLDDNEEIVGTREYLMTLAEDILDTTVDTYADPKADDAEDWDLNALKREVERVYAVETSDLDFSERSSAEIRDLLWAKVLTAYEDKEKLIGREVLQRLERDLMLQLLDQQWKDHLYSLDHLKEGIGLRGYGQRDPLVEYKKESFAMFQAMKERVDEESVRYLWGLRPVIGEEAPVRRPAAPPRQPLIMNNPSTEAPSAFGPRAPRPTAEASPFAPPRGRQPARVGGDDAVPKTVRREEPKVGRNDPCPCGSGKKYKKCHGALQPSGGR